mmetsp:Transcript_34779/g.77336  ORF Transcript_34779/g.77336 Transcript_34779/m.77336 type:complete len:92 (-) Transcript_34779:6-281(-)
MLRHAIRLRACNTLTVKCYGISGKKVPLLTKRLLRRGSAAKSSANHPSAPDSSPALNSYAEDVAAATTPMVGAGTWASMDMISIPDVAAWT